MVPLTWYLVVAAILFSIGVFGAGAQERRGDSDGHRADAQRRQH
jgi:hypothetical protein